MHGDQEWGEPDAEEVLRRINGYHLDTGKLVGDYRELRADGSTSSGCWIYAGVFKGGVNLSARRGDGPDGKWGWVWPLDRRVLYNRASADPAGKPWSERKKLVWWDEELRRWVGDDIPDFPDDLPPDHVPPPGRGRARGVARRRPVRAPGRREGVAVRAQRGRRRADADALRARRVAGDATRCTARGRARCGAATPHSDNPANPDRARCSRSCSPRRGSPSTTRRAG